MTRFARWCFRRRRLVLAGWLIALVGLAAAGHAAGMRYATKYTLPDTPSARALAILQHNFPTASGDTDQIVVQAKTGAVTSAPARSEVEAMLAKEGASRTSRPWSAPLAPAAPARPAETGGSRSRQSTSMPRPRTSRSPPSPP